MIDAKVAAEQMERLMGLSFAPQTPAAKKELRLAIEHAATQEIARNTVTDWLNESGECPKPSDLHRMIAGKNTAVTSARLKCQFCDGSGFTTIWRLVTYHGASFRIRNTESITGTSAQSAFEVALDVRRAIPDGQTALTKGWLRQDVLSAAKACSCRLPVEDGR